MWRRALGSARPRWCAGCAVHKSFDVWPIPDACRRACWAWPRGLVAAEHTGLALGSRRQAAYAVEFLAQPQNLLALLRDHAQQLLDERRPFVRRDLESQSIDNLLYIVFFLGPRLFPGLRPEKVAPVGGSQVATKMHNLLSMLFFNGLEHFTIACSGSRSRQTSGRGRNAPEFW